MAYKVPEFITPEHIKELQDFEKNLTNILSLYPSDIDTSVGGFVFDFMAPIAALEEEIAVYHLPEALKQMFVYWANGFYLDMHAMTRNLSRNAATYATGKLEITTDREVIIPQGSIFTTVSTQFNEAQSYITSQECRINGKELIDVTAVDVGVKGNTNSDTVILQEKIIEGITKVTNPLAITGGSEIEDDEHLRQRCIDYDRHYNKSFIGNNFDYKMWAEDVDGVGMVDVIAAEIDDGIVTIVLTDANNDPANSELIEKVRLKIMGEHVHDLKRLAPCNAKLKIIPVELNIINIIADVKLESGHNIDVIKKEYIKALEIYFREAKEEKVVRFTEVGGSLIETAGVDDYSNLKINGNTVNVELTNIQMPRVGTVTLNVV